MHVLFCLHAWMCVCLSVCVSVLAIVVHGNVPPWLYMHVFFAVGFPKERAFGTLVPRWTHPKTRYSMRSLKSQPNIKMQHHIKNNSSCQSCEDTIRPKTLALNTSPVRLSFSLPVDFFPPKIPPKKSCRLERYCAVCFCFLVLFFFKAMRLQLALNWFSSRHVAAYQLIILDSQRPKCPSLQQT